MPAYRLVEDGIFPVRAFIELQFDASGTRQAEGTIVERLVGRHNTRKFTIAHSIGGINTTFGEVEGSSAVGEPEEW